MFACQLSSHLADLEHELKIVSVYDGDAMLPFKDVIIPISNICSNRYFDFKGWKRLADIINDFKPDIIQANAADTLKYAVFSKIIFRWRPPIVFRNAGTTSYYIKNKFSKIINSLLLRNVTKIISVSNASKRDLNCVFPSTKWKTVVVPIGIEPLAIVELTHPFLINRVNIIHVGSFTREKNHQGLLSIFKKLNTVSHKYCLHLIGDGGLRKIIEDNVRLLNLQDFVIFHEANRNPLSFIKAADILVLPSNIEGLPAVILESMICKTPVVAYDVGGISEIVNSQTGSLIEHSDEDGFVKAILDTIEYPKSSRIEAAHKMVVHEYMNRAIALRFVDIYNSIVCNPQFKKNKIM